MKIEERKLKMDVDLSKIRLAITLPHTDKQFQSDFVDSYFCLDKPLQSIYIRPKKGGHQLDVIRNQLVQKALEYDCTHIWMCDTDQIYPQNVIMRLLNHNLDIVSAKVHRRYPPYDPILLRGKKHLFNPVPDEEWSKGGLIEVDATGGGSILFNTKVFKNIPKPWFKFESETEEGIHVGEDINFCCKLREQGFRIFVDCDIKIGHIATMIITEESYWAYKFTQDPAMKPIGEQTVFKKSIIPAIKRERNKDWKAAWGQEKKEAKNA